MMKNIFLMFLTLVSFYQCGYYYQVQENNINNFKQSSQQSSNKDILKDTRDGKEYKTTKIGNQIWMAENLNTEYFQNGDKIEQAKTNEEWIEMHRQRKPAWCYYMNDEKNGSIYGKLYNWHAVNDYRGLAPNGWAIPSDKDWQDCIDFLGGDKKAGKLMRTASESSNNKNASNLSGFDAQYGGLRYGSGRFLFQRMRGHWWSRSLSVCKVVQIEISHNSNSVKKEYQDWSLGLSVRCIKLPEEIKKENIGTSNPSNDSLALFRGCPTGLENIPSDNERFEQQVFDLTNAEREKKGLPKLEWNEDLARAARYHAADMVIDNYYNHNTFDIINEERVMVCSAFERIMRFGNGRAENITRSTLPQSALNSWIRSSGHYQNILGDYKTIGIGYKRISNTEGMYVQVFGN